MTRWYLGAAALLVACGDSKPKSDSSLAAAPDTVKAAVVSAPDTVKPTTPAASKTTKTGGVRPDEVGRDKAIQPNPKRTLPPNDSTVVGRDSVVIPKGGFKTLKQPKDTHP